MTNKMNFILNEKAGYVMLPRTLAEIVMKRINIEDAASLYFYLLLSANYYSKANDHGMIKRGEVGKSIKQIAEDTNTDYTRLRRLMKQLKEEELVDFNNHIQHPCILLPYYEEHCGRKIHTTEQADEIIKNQTDTDFENFWEFYHTIVHVPETDYEEARKAFSKLSCKERRLAAENVDDYYELLDNEKHAKWTSKYLKEKCFILPNNGK